MTQTRDIIVNGLATTMYAMHTTVATTLDIAPSSLASAWDVFLNVPVISDWQAIAHLHEHHVHENLQWANRKHLGYDYDLAQQVLKKVHNPPTKLGVRTEGPHTIDHVHINGNLTIILCDGVTECINICRVLLYCYHSIAPFGSKGNQHSDKLCTYQLYNQSVSKQSHPLYVCRL